MQHVSFHIFFVVSSCIYDWIFALRTNRHSLIDIQKCTNTLDAWYELQSSHELWRAPHYPTRWQRTWMESWIFPRYNHPRYKHHQEQLRIISSSSTTSSSPFSSPPPPLCCSSGSSFTNTPRAQRSNWDLDASLLKTLLPPLWPSQGRNHIYPCTPMS